jgi:hypothetical protein
VTTTTLYGQLELELQRKIQQAVERGVDRAQGALTSHPHFSHVLKNPAEARHAALVAIEAYVTELRLHPPAE